MVQTNSEFIRRQGLLDLLNSVAEEQILYICAPAGYGKTVITRQWLAEDGSHALLALDEFDDDPSHFCQHFCQALLLCQPDNSKLAELTQHKGFHSAPVEFTAKAIVSLDKDKPARLAVDDLHFVSGEETHRLLLRFLRKLPEGFRIALVGRSELPAGYSELLLKGHIARIGPDRLRFNQDEIIALYQKNKHKITAEQADEIHHFTYGWAIGLGALLLADGTPGSGILQYLDDFLHVNVWQRWDEDKRDFMIKTAVARDLTPPLCAALTGRKNSGAILDQLIQENAFLTKTEQGIYRYHRLFQDFLLKKLAEQDENIEIKLVEKAGFWHLSQGDFYNAAECFIRCKSHKGMVKSFIFYASIDRSNFNADKIIPLLEHPFIHEVAESFAYVYSIMSWAAYVKGETAKFVEYIDKYYEKQLSTLRYDPRLAFSFIYARIVDFRIPLIDIVKMTERVPRPLMALTAGVTPSIGIINQYMPLLHRGTRDFSECALGDMGANVAVILKAIGHLFGDEAPLLAHSLSAGLHYERGDLQNAYQHCLAANAEIAERFETETKYMAMSMLVFVHDALGHHSAALSTLKAIGNMIEKESAYFLNYNYTAMKTRRRLQEGDETAARAWLDDYAAPLHNALDFYKLYGHMTTGRAYIALGDYDSATLLLEKVLKLTGDYNRPLDSIEARILLSIACWKKKSSFQTEAIRHLEQALILAYPYGYTQLFINDGGELAGMLLRVKHRAEQNSGDNMPPPDFVKMLYLGTQKARDEGAACRWTDQTVKIKFTDKQKKIMELLTAGKSYREITTALGITRPTLRSHLSAIYNKLGVANGTEAVLKINTMGLLDGDG